MLMLLTFGVIFAFLIYIFIIKPALYWKKLGIHHNSLLWNLNEILKILLKKQSFAEFLMKLQNQFETARYSGGFQFTKPMLILHDPDLIKQITVEDFGQFSDHQIILRENTDPLISKSLIGLKSKEWKDMRTVMSPWFTSKKLNTIFNIMVKTTDGLIDYFVKRMVNDGDVIEIDMKDVSTRYANDIIASTVFGIKIDSLTKPNNTFYRMGNEFTDMSNIWKMLKFSGYIIIPKILQFFDVSVFPKYVSKYFYNLVKSIINFKQNIAKQDNTIPSDMIQMLLDARNKCKSNDMKPITDMDIAAQVLLFFFAGFDSVTTLMSFAAYELAINKNIQDKLRDEIRETYASCNGKLTYEALMNMKYCDMVISESLRKWPPAMVTTRLCNKPYTIKPINRTEQSLKINPGTLILIPIYAIHHDPKHYPDHDKFNPERFNKENKAKIKPYAYLPFGSGPRNCIGMRFGIMETKIFLYHLLLNFEIIPAKRTIIPAKISKTRFKIGIEGGFNLALKRI